MYSFGKLIVKLRWGILVVALLLIFPCIYGMINTRINYDMLDYLPEDMETVKGQNILLKDFNIGAFSLIMVEGMEPKDINALVDKMEKVEHVKSVLSYSSVTDLSIPMEVLPQKYYNALQKGDTTLMAAFFDTSTSADETIEAISDIREVAGKQCFVSGMSALVTDLKELCEKEEPIYVGIAVALACLAMMIFMDSWILPFIFLASIGLSILWNLGSNFMFGEISYITKALSAVLQLAVTMDYSIFLWHSYSEEKQKGLEHFDAMSRAITNTITSVLGSSLTTVAGFIALCFMSYTLGLDLGLVMAKGVVFGVIGCVTTLPVLILLFDKAIEKTRHRSLLPNTDKIAAFITKRSWVFLLVFLIIIGPAFYGNMKTEKYYDLGRSLPKDLDCAIANTKLSEEFDMASTHMILCDSSLSAKDAMNMTKELEKVDGVKAALSLNSVLGTLVPEEMLPNSLVSVLKSENYQLMLVSSEYKVATDNMANQITALNKVIKNYDKNGMLIGEASCTNDMIKLTDHDFKVVDIISIGAIFLIILLVLKSFSLPFILVAVIEFAIFINLGIPYFTGTQLPFITPICISTIQLGATVDYAILMTTRYKRERHDGHDKHDAVNIALSTSIPSIIVSAAGFFMATFGVGMYSDIDMISSMCLLMSRGAVISMLSVIFVLPAMFMLFDKAICASSIGFKPNKKRIKESVNL